MKTKFSDQICIKEVLIAKYSVKMLMVATIIYNKFKNDMNQELTDLDFSEFEYKTLELDDIFPDCYGLIKQFSNYNWRNKSIYSLTDEGKEFIKLVKARKETRYLLNKNCDLFPETANLILV